MSRRNKFRAIDNETIKLYDRVTKIETDVLAKFIALKKQKVHFQCPHLELRQECEPYQPFSDYYSRFWKTFLTARLNQSRIEILEEEVGDLKKEIQWIEKKYELYGSLVAYRRQKNRIFKQKFLCEVRGCNKNYQTQGALDLHQKVKHPISEHDEYNNSSIQIGSHRSHSQND